MNNYRGAKHKSYWQYFEVRTNLYFCKRECLYLLY